MWTEVPALAAALVLTEVGFKLHSFTLECGVFLALWFVLGLVFSRLAGNNRRGGGSAHS